MMSENEINYLIEILKRKQTDPLAEVIKMSTLKKYFERAAFTYSFVMEKLSLQLVQKKVMAVYKLRLK